jgi:hypothetical protein
MHIGQGCQIVLGTIYRKSKNIPNDLKTYQKTINDTNCPQHVPIFSIPKPSK